jgi:bzd-type benzoyl-CoA reductase Q subunit
MLGGLGYNPGFVEALRRQLDLNKIFIPDNPEYGAAVGSAIVAAEEILVNKPHFLKKPHPKVSASLPSEGQNRGYKFEGLENTMKTGEKKQEFWRWSESNWKNPDIDWNNAKYLTVGIDVGSVSSQAVIMADGEVFIYGNMRTGSDSLNSAESALNFTLESTDMTEDRIDYAIGTGYGRVNVPFADRSLTEIACHARGANYIYGPEVRTVLDVGGQDIKVIQCDDKGKVTNFLMNDKCAAGTGRGMEVFADLLGIAIDQVGERSFDVKEEPPAVSSTCVVYAKSEATGLLRKGWSTEEVLAAYCRAMAERIYSLVERIGVVPEFAITGGMAKNRGVIDRLLPMVGLKAMEANWDTQIAGAVGAALFGYTLCQKGKGRKK